MFTETPISDEATGTDESMSAVAILVVVAVVILLILVTASLTFFCVTSKKRRTNRRMRSTSTTASNATDRSSSSGDRSGYPMRSVHEDNVNEESIVRPEVVTPSGFPGLPKYESMAPLYTRRDNGGQIRITEFSFGSNRSSHDGAFCVDNGQLPAYNFAFSVESSDNYHERGPPPSYSLAIQASNDHIDNCELHRNTSRVDDNNYNAHASKCISSIQEQNDEENGENPDTIFIVSSSLPTYEESFQYNDVSLPDGATSGMRDDFSQTDTVV
jgi:hypothetical protein